MDHKRPFGVGDFVIYEPLEDDFEPYMGKSAKVIELADDDSVMIEFADGFRINAFEEDLAESSPAW